MFRIFYLQTGALEGQFFKKTGKLVSLSEQNLVDCSKQDSGCDGGLPINAFTYVQNNGGIDTEESYPYQAVQSDCRYDQKNSAGKISGYVSITKGSEDDLKSAVATVGPISVGIFAGPIFFQLYGGGVYYDPFCPIFDFFGILNHAVLVVGYGTTIDGKDYWLVKNSWGTQWGELGYIRMYRNENNHCGIATMATYPLAV